MSKSRRRSYAWKPALDDETAAVVVTLKRGDKPRVHQMEGPVDLLSKILEAINAVPAPRPRRRTRSDG